MYKGKITKYFNIIPMQVTGLKVTEVECDKITLKWSAQNYIDGYEIYDTEESKSYFTTNNIYYFSNLKEGTLHVYSVRAYKIINEEKYYGEFSSNLFVNTKPIIDISICPITGIKNKPYTGRKITQNVVVKYDGKALRNGIDYIVSYSNNIKLGKASVIITGKGNYIGTTVKTFTIIPQQVTGLKVKEQGKDSIKLNWKKQTGVKGYKLYSYNYKKSKWEYVGKTSNTSYKVKGLKPGTTYKYRVRAYIEINRVQFVGEYSSNLKTGTKTKTPSISKLTTKSKKATIKWKKISGASGYEIYMATSKNGKYSRIKTVTKASTTSYTKTKLKNNKKYYFKIRTYKTVDGKKIYSSYSSIKSIKIK